MTTISRSDMGWPNTPAPFAYTDTGIVIHYNGKTSWKLAGKKCDSFDGCKGYWRWCREFHMEDNGWQDIGYSYFCCPHGNTYVGRGYHRVQAAQPGGNMTWTSVTTGLGAGEQPTEAQINEIRRLRAVLMKRGLKSAISWHGRFISTSCPGTVLIDMVKAGVFSKPPMDSEGDTDVILPMLRVGEKSYDVKTVRALLYARGTVHVPKDAPANWLVDWLDSQKFDDDLKKRVIEYQKAAFPADDDEWDGIVGPRTWSKLMRERTQ